MLSIHTNHLLLQGSPDLLVQLHELFVAIAQGAQPYVGLT
jgi:hypothetical protein